MWKIKIYLPLILDTDDPLDFVRVTNKSKENIIIVSESVLIQLVQRCIYILLQDDLSQMFVNILNHPVSTDQSR